MAAAQIHHQSEWNSRFHVSKSQANHETNNFYREFFDKPSSITHERLIQPKREHSLTNPVDARFPTKSKAVRKGSSDIETGWNTRFHILYSKDNNRIHAHHRSYFDHPREKGKLSGTFSTSPYSRRSTSMSTGRQVVQKPIKHRVTGLYGRNKTITDENGNLTLRESPESMRR